MSNWDLNNVPGFGDTPKHLGRMSDGFEKGTIQAREVAAEMRRADRQSRLQQLEHWTTPDMRGFFPAQSSGRKSKVLTFADTETDDRNRILTLAAFKVVFNYDKFRFERADENDPGFFRVYNPVNVDKNIAITESTHGLFGDLLAGMRKRSGATYSSNWDLSQLEAFNEYVGNDELAGHNIVKADLPWLLRPTGRDFNADTYKKGFFDTLHYARAIEGFGNSALQKLKAKYLPGFKLPEHEASSDVVLNIKVLEEMIKHNAQSPYTAEALYAFGLKGVQTHTKERVNLSEGIGAITAGARGKPLHGLPYVGAKEALIGYNAARGFNLDSPQVLDLKEAFDIPQDVYDQVRSVGGYLGANYTEEHMSDIDKSLLDDYEGPLKTLADRYRYLDSIKPRVSESGLALDKDSQRIVKFLRSRVNKRGAGAGDATYDLASDTYKNVDAELINQLRDYGFGDNPSPELRIRYIRRALSENAFAYWQKQVQYNTTAGNLLAKNKQYAGQSWYDEFARVSEEDMSPARIEQFREERKNYLAEQKADKKRIRDEQKEARRQREAREDERLRDIQAWQSNRDAREKQIKSFNAWASAEGQRALRGYNDEQAAQEKSAAQLKSQNDADTLAYLQGQAARLSRQGIAVPNAAVTQDNLWYKVQHVGGVNVAEPVDAELQLKTQAQDKKAQGAWYDRLMKDIDNVVAERQKREDKIQGWRADSTKFWSKAAVDQRLEQGKLVKQAQHAFNMGALMPWDMSKLEGLKGSTKAYGDELDKMILRNRKLLSVTKQLNSIPMYNPMQLLSTFDNQTAGIKHAAHGILPSFMERPVFRFGDAIGNLWKQTEANIQYRWDMLSMGGKAAGTLGGAALGSLLGPGGAAVGSNVGGFIGGGISQILGGYSQKRITEMGEGVQHRLNLIGMTTSLLGAFANGLKMAIGLFGKLGQIWSYMPSYTLHNLTGNSWAKAQPMQAGDRLLGFQSGTVANMFNQLAYQQADLYTSGMYNETQLVSAARLGIFDLAYSPMGGDVRKQQEEIYDRLYTQLYESGLSKAEQQSMMSLVKNYSPEMMSMLERGQGMVQAGYSQYRHLSGFTDSYGRSFLDSNGFAGENARVSRASQMWDLDQRSFRDAIALAGSKAYEMGEPVIKALETSLWNFVRNGDLNLDRVWEELGKLMAKIDFSGIDFSGWGDKFKGLADLLDPLLEEVKKKLTKWVPEVLRSFYDSMAGTKIKFDALGLFRAMLSGKEFEFSDYVQLNSPHLNAKQLAEKAEAARQEAEDLKNAKSWAIDGVAPIAYSYWDTKNTVYAKSPVAFLSNEAWNGLASKQMRAYQAEGMSPQEAYAKLSTQWNQLNNVTHLLSDADIDASPAATSAYTKAMLEEMSDESRAMLADILKPLLESFEKTRTSNINTVFDTGTQAVIEVIKNLIDAINAGQKVSLRVEDATLYGTQQKIESMQTAWG